MTRLARIFHASPILRSGKKAILPEEAEAWKRPRGRPGHRSKNPLVARIKDHSLTLGRVPLRKFKARVNVVSEQLCDDILKFLKPSLEQYKGCDVLEYFPGAGLWTRAVHDLLKPRRHVLMEFSGDAYMPFLQPLLDQPGSTYEYKALDRSNKQMKEDGVGRIDVASLLLDEFLNSPPESITGSQTPLLILANLSRHYQVNRIDHHAWSKTLPASHYFFQKVMININQDSLNYKRRPVRFLTWIFERDKTDYIPRTLSLQNATTLKFEETFQAQEIVSGLGWTPAKGDLRSDGAGRAASLIVQSALQVAERMRASGLSLPFRRQSPLHKFVLEDLRGSEDSEAFTATMSGTSSNLASRLEALRVMEVQYALGMFGEGRNQKNQNPTVHAARQNMRELQDSFYAVAGDEQHSPERNFGPLRAGILHMLLAELEISIALRRSTHPLIRSAPDTKDCFVLEVPQLTTDERRIITADELTTLAPAPPLGAVSRGSHSAQLIADNAVSYLREHPILTWDRRQFEPLSCEPEEFFPDFPLSLLDITLREDFPKRVSAGEGGAKMIPLFRIPPINEIRRYPSMNIPKALDMVAHGAAAAILPNCPAINDPAKGGRINPRHLRVRMLTDEMWREIAREWYKWPFRTPDSEILDSTKNISLNQVDEDK